MLPAPMPPPPSLLRRLARPLIISAIILLAAHLLDPWAYDYFRWSDQERLERRDWYRLFRVMGYLPTWLNLAGALMLVEAARRRQSPHLFAMLPTGQRARHPALGGAVALVAAAAIAGSLVELIKPIVGRERPEGLGYVFKPFLYGFIDNDNLGFPSSHAAVAFGAAFALGRLFKGCGPVVIGLAVGCAVSRLHAGAHWLSDVTAAAIIAWFTARAIVPGECRP